MEGAGGEGVGADSISSPFDSSSPFAGGGSPFGNNAQSPWFGGFGGHGSEPVKNGQGGGRQSATGGADSDAARRAEIECQRDSERIARDLEQLCTMSEGIGMCNTYRQGARCVQQIINRATTLRCPDDIKQQTLAAGRNMIEQMRSNARQVCTNSPGF
jgi:hypothetical protein